MTSRGTGAMLPFGSLGSVVSLVLPDWQVSQGAKVSRGRVRRRRRRWTTAAFTQRGRAVPGWAGWQLTLCTFRVLLPSPTVVATRGFQGGREAGKWGMPTWS